MKPSNHEILQRLDRLLALLERFAAQPQKNPPDFANEIAFRWIRQGQTNCLQPVRHPHTITLDALRNIDEQKQRLDRNTKQFIAGLPANHALLTGARGTGKSSLVKALLNAYACRGLRLIEVDKQVLIDLPELVDSIGKRPERFILYCDDLSFEANESGYKALKVVLDGSIATASENILVYATSNRRHLMPEFMDENLAARHIDGEIHPGESTEEKISLSERFGLWLSFHPFDQDQYIDIVAYWLARYGIRKMSNTIRQAALRWALARGSRSGRVARQFADDWVGRYKLSKASDDQH